MASGVVSKNTFTQNDAVNSTVSFSITAHGITLLEYPDGNLYGGTSKQVIRTGSTSQVVIIEHYDIPNNLNRSLSLEINWNTCVATVKNNSLGANWNVLMSVING